MTYPSFDLSPSTNPPSPLPPASDASPASPRGDAEGGGSLNDKQRQALNEAIERAALNRDGASGWSVGAIRKAARDALAGGFSVNTITGALVVLSVDPDGTRYPGRLRHFLEVEAAQDAGKADAQPPPSSMPASYGVSTLTSGRPQCLIHPGYPADNCRPCLIDAAVTAREASTEQVAQQPAVKVNEPEAAALERAAARDRIAAGRRRLAAQERRAPATKTGDRALDALAALDEAVREIQPVDV